MNPSAALSMRRESAIVLSQAWLFHESDYTQICRRLSKALIRWITKHCSSFAKFPDVFCFGRETGRETLRDVRETHDEWLVVRPTNRLTQYDRPTNKQTEAPYINHITCDHKNKQNIRHTMPMCSKKGRKNNGEYVGNMRHTT